MKQTLYQARNQQSLTRTEIAKEVLKQYKAKHPKDSILKIAKDWGISQPTLVRVENQTTEVSLEVFLQILSGSQNTKKMAEYMELTDPSLYEALNLCFAHSLEKLHYLIDPKTVDGLYGNFKHNKKYRPFISQYIGLFGDKENLDILLQASTRKGLPKKDVKKKGMEELIKAQTLENLRVIELDDNQIYRTKEHNFRLPFHIIKKNIEHALKYYRIEEAGKDNNWISFQTESLNKNALKEYKEILRKQFIERAEFFEDRDNDGEFCVVTSCYSSTV